MHCNMLTVVSLLRFGMEPRSLFAKVVVFCSMSTSTNVVVLRDLLTLLTISACRPTALWCTARALLCPPAPCCPRCPCCEPYHGASMLFYAQVLETQKLFVFPAYFQFVYSEGERARARGTERTRSLPLARARKERKKEWYPHMLKRKRRI